MGYYSAIGRCAVCCQMFQFNPHKVPSVRIGGVREPICLDCVNEANPRRKAAGIEEIVPLPGAYDSVREEEF